jgi:hypothetical protein
MGWQAGFGAATEWTCRGDQQGSSTAGDESEELGTPRERRISQDSACRLAAAFSVGKHVRREYLYLQLVVLRVQKLKHISKIPG